MAVPIFIFGLLFSFSLSTLGKPRSPLPPLPEMAPVLEHIDFNEPLWDGGGKAEFFTTAYGELWESWSGYSLVRGGQSVSPYILPLISDSGKTNLTASQGAIRLWFQPDWTTGSGPGKNARLLEMNVLPSPQMYVNWSLYFSDDGSKLILSGQTGKGAADLLSAEIKWESGASHCLGLNYSEKQTELFIDGNLVAQGGGVLPVSPSVSGLVVGSTIEGTDTASGQFDEITTFGRPLSAAEVSFYYSALKQTAALGPISAAEEAQKAAVAKYRQELQTESESSGAYRVNGGVTNCPTNGPVYITNIFSILTTNGDATVTFDIVGGTNGILYDIFSATNLVGNSITNGAWTWLEQGYTCNSYIYTNQPGTFAFYVLGTPLDTDSDGLTDAYEFLVSKTDSNDSDTDNDGIPDGWEVAHGLNPLVNDASDDPDGDWLTNFQEYQAGSNPHDKMVVAWGENLFGECDVPPGLRDVVAVAGGFNFSMALRSNGTVVVWGQNDYGQTNVPADLTNAASISAWLWYTEALRQDGTVAQWGALVHTVPSSATNLAAISVGYDYAVGLRSNGTLISWGENSYRTNLLAGLTNVAAIATSTDHKVALLSNQTLVAWGLTYSNLGWNLTNVPADLTNVSRIAVGEFHTLALKADGTVGAWGAGGPTNTSENYLGAEQGQSVVPSGLSNVTAIAAGGYHSMALRTDGTIVSWGDLTPGYLQSNYVAIGSGTFHGLAIRSGRLLPLMAKQPSDRIDLAGTNITFTAQGVGLAGVLYQWQLNGTNISGATNSTLTLTNVQAANEGSYRVIISTGAGSVTTSNANFTLVIPPVIVSKTPSTNPLVIYARRFTLSVTATAPGQFDGFPLSYQWKFNGINIIGATASNCTTYALPGTYSVIVSNAAGSTNAAWEVTTTYEGSYIDVGTLAYHLSTNAVSRTNGFTDIASAQMQLTNWTYAEFTETNLGLLTNAVWSTNCWLKGVQGLSATCIAVSNNVGGQWLVTMVSPRHYLRANHTGTPAMMAFLDTNNVIYWRTSLQQVQVAGDTDVGILDADLPSSIGFLSVVPTNLSNYLPTNGPAVIQAIGLNQTNMIFSQPMKFGYQAVSLIRSSRC